MPRFLSLWLPRWPIQRFIRAQSEHDPSTPLLLYQESRRGLCVAACCPLASRQGVRAGMPLAEASSLAGHGKSAQPQAVPYDPLADELALQQLALECEPFSPLIGLDEADPPAGLLLDCSGLARHFGGERLLAQQLVEHLQQRRYVCHVAIAETIGIAWGAARFGDQRIECIDAGDPCVEQLPIEALRLPEETAATLHSLGIHRIEQVAALPRRELRSRFDDLFLTRWWQWQGEVPEIIRPVERRLVIEAGTDLEYVVTEKAGVCFFLDELISQLVVSLQEHRLGAIRLECRLRGELGEAAALTIGFREPCIDANRMRQLLRLQLDEAALPNGVERIGLRVTEYAALRTHQTAMFHSRSIEKSAELTRLIDLLSARLGDQRVTRPQLRAEYQPEYAYAAPPAIHVPAPRSSPVGTPQRGTRPLLLLSPAQTVPDMALDRNGLPLEFHYRQALHRVVACSGAETIETGWWRGVTIRRDYHRVLTDLGSVLWLFRTLDTNQWFVHGEFL